MHVPASLASYTAAPLLLFFHGYQSSAREVQAMAGLDRVADERGFATVYPEGIEASWAIGCGGCTPADARGVDDVALVRTLVAQLGRGRAVDRGRVYAGGYSQGGMLSHRLACELADQVAAVASVAGGITRAVSPRCAPARPLPIALFHGTADPNVPWEGGPFLLSVPETLARWAALNGCAGKAIEPLPDPVPDGTTVRRETCTGCAADTVLYAIEGGGHTWPGYPTDFPPIYGRTTHDISAADLIGEFLSRQRLP
jgi:polyhydroxybutyrate depolymerase